MEELVKIGDVDPVFGAPPNAIAFAALKKGLFVELIGETRIISSNNRKHSAEYKKFLVSAGANKDKIFGAKCIKEKEFSFIKLKPSSVLIENCLLERKLVVAVVDWGVIADRKKLIPHYILITGYGKRNFFANNLFPKYPSKRKISKKLFWKAWNSNGMRMPLLVLSKK